MWFLCLFLSVSANISLYFSPVSSLKERKHNLGQSAELHCSDHAVREDMLKSNLRLLSHGTSVCGGQKRCYQSASYICPDQQTELPRSLLNPDSSDLLL